MQNVHQQSQQYTSQTPQPGYYQNKQHVQLTRMQSTMTKNVKTSVKKTYGKW